MSRSAVRGLGPDHVRSSAALIRDGRVIDLAIDLDSERLPPLDAAFGRPLRLETIIDPAEWIARVGSGPSGFHLDAFGGSIHAGTHIDGFAHIVHEGRIFGGAREADARTDRGWTTAGAETIPPIVGRGILIDLVRVRGGRPLEGSHGITIDELTEAMEETGAELTPGDIVLVRTGKIRELAGDRSRFLDRQPGIGVAAAIWLAEHGMVVYGSDTGGTEPQPVTDWTRTVHVELLTVRGIHLIEWLALDELAEVLEASQRTDFLFVAAPLRIVGATGSWIRPIAIT